MAYYIETPKNPSGLGQEMICVLSPMGVADASGGVDLAIRPVKTAFGVARVVRFAAVRPALAYGTGTKGGLARNRWRSTRR